MPWPVRNLIYHVCPLKGNDLWRVNVRQLCRRMHVFDGRRVIAIAVGEGLEPPAMVPEAFAAAGCDPATITWLQLPNCRLLREVATFGPLLEAIADSDPHQVSFYAHTKGNSTACSVLGATRWRNAMYHHLLDRWEATLAELSTPAIAAVGTHQLFWGQGRPPYPSHLRHGEWCFAGTFFWFRHDRIFTHPRWREVPRDRYGAEAWLSGLFAADQVASVYQPTAGHLFNPYDPKIYEDSFDD